mmetsp:Transcript_11060/g.26836  ORF Transcript_11060/g.26836 Transcript_11060/m.26836 type:complete len:274 (+) Transcript_11060:1636-2457(+)
MHLVLLGSQAHVDGGPGAGRLFDRLHQGRRGDRGGPLRRNGQRRRDLRPDRRRDAPHCRGRHLGFRRRRAPHALPRAARGLCQGRGQPLARRARDGAHARVPCRDRGPAPQGGAASDQGLPARGHRGAHGHGRQPPDRPRHRPQVRDRDPGRPPRGCHGRQDLPRPRAGRERRAEAGRHRPHLAPAPGSCALHAAGQAPPRLGHPGVDDHGGGADGRRHGRRDQRRPCAQEGGRGVLDGHPGDGRGQERVRCHHHGRQLRVHRVRCQVGALRL